MWNKLADNKTIEITAAALKVNGINVVIVGSGQEARNKTLSLIPPTSEVMTMTSVTLDTIGLSEEINKKDGKFNPVRDRLYSMDRNIQTQEMNRLGAASQFTIGSAHAITKDGHILIASNTGSQLPAYAYSSQNVILVVGTQKIVENLDEGIKRIYEYTLPLESERAKKAYGVPGSAVNKLLIINKEIQQGRITLILVKENLGF